MCCRLYCMKINVKLFLVMKVIIVYHTGELPYGSLAEDGVKRKQEERGKSSFLALTMAVRPIQL